MENRSAAMNFESRDGAGAAAEGSYKTLIPSRAAGAKVTGQGLRKTIM